MQAGLVIRPELESDHAQVEHITREAFWNVNVPGCDEHYLAHTLRAHPAFIGELDYVAELDKVLVGNIMYARAVIHSPKGLDAEVLSFGPVSVIPSLQGKGIGSALIRHTLALARDLGWRAVVIYGDPDYYRRFGFEPAERHNIQTADGWYLPALQVLELVPGALDGISGCFDEGDAYRVDPNAAAEFDRHFPPKIKAETPSQEKFKAMLAQAHH